MHVSIFFPSPVYLKPVRESDQHIPEVFCFKTIASDWKKHLFIWHKAVVRASFKLMLQTETKKDNRKRFFDLEVLEQDLAKYRLQKDMVRLQIDILKILKKEALAHLFHRRFFLWDRERKSELEIKREINFLRWKEPSQTFEVLFM